MIDIEPEHVIGEFSHFVPKMREEFQQLLAGPNAAVKAATAIRVAISHYIIRCDDADQFLATQVKRVVLHEVAHHFGISDERLVEIDRY